MEPQNPIDRRTVFAFVLMFAVWFGWMALFQSEPPVEDEPTEVASTPLSMDPDTPEREVPTPTFEPEPQVIPPGGEGWVSIDSSERGTPIEVRTPLFQAEIDPVGGDVLHYQLNRFDLVDGTPVDLVYDLTTELGTQRAHALRLIYEDRSLDLRDVRFESDRRDVAVDAGDSNQVLRLRAQRGDGTQLELRYVFYPDRYGFDVKARVLSPANAVRFPMSFAVSWPGGIAPTEPDSSSEYSEFKAVARVGEDIHKVKFSDLAKGKPDKGHETYEGTVSWGGVLGKYFLAAVVSPDPRVGAVRLTGDAGLGVQTFETRLSMQGEREALLDYSVVFGPIDTDELGRYDRDPWNAELTKLVDLGPSIFRPVAQVTLAGLRLLYHVIPNWGWTIIIFSALTKLLFYPLTKSSTVSMKRMQEIQPKMQKLREKYKDDQQKQSEEMFKLYKEHGVNPMGGCLPLLVQMPVFWALFTVLRKTIDLRQADFMLWIDDLSRPDVLATMPFSLPVLGDKVCLLPFLMAIGMWAQTKLSQPAAPAGDGLMAQNARMMGTIMPIMMFVLFYNSPSGLVLYWLVNTILTALQTWRIHSKSASPKPATA